MNANEANRERRVRDVFLEALDQPAAERAAFLSARCGADTALRVAVERLLTNFKEDSFLENAAPTVLSPAPAQDPISCVVEGPGSVIGRYKLLQKIGEGGCGVVYMAEQEVPVRRRVALKVIKPGLDSKVIIARFEAERQALAMMDHPNIARILDAGVMGGEVGNRGQRSEISGQRSEDRESKAGAGNLTPDLRPLTTGSGRPYFVMELVQGVPITEFCDRNKLSCKERLRLFVQVCGAIQSAHQKGIIHRDIKPSNILVTINHGEPTPKVIDFGIAKATDQKLTEKTLFTQFGMLIGTPAYMSPGQAEMTSLDVDTRSDIYSLGVLLYELLTGTTPFTQKRLLSAGFGEMQRVILEEEPERPSTRLSTLANEERTAVARSRGEDFARVQALLKGDLDWVVMKCLEKDRRRRYETAAGLAADIGRHLNLEPVTARPPSATYKFQRLIARNRAASVAVAVILLSLIGAVGFSTVAYLKERRARLALAAAETAREEARRKAESEGVRADEVVDFVGGFFDSAIPDLAQHGHHEAIRHMLDMSETMAGRLTNAPATEAGLLLRILMARDVYLTGLVLDESQITRLELRAQAAGAAGRHAATMARNFRLRRKMLENAAPELKEEAGEIALRQAAEDSMKLVPPDTQSAAWAQLAIANSRRWGLDAAKARAVTAARECLRVAPDDEAHRGFRFGALASLVQTLPELQEWSQAETAAKDAIGLFPVLKPAEASGAKGWILVNYARITAKTGHFDEFEATLNSLLDRLPESDRWLRSAVHGARGEAWVRHGEWQRGFELLRGAATNSEAHFGIWLTTAVTALLVNDTNSWRSLCASGVGRFTAGANEETSRMLADTLMAGPVDPAMIPVIRFLVDRSIRNEPHQGSMSLSLASLEYFEGKYADAEARVSRLIEVWKDNHLGTEIRLVRAAIRARMGRLEEAREDYRQGAAMVSPHFRNGHPAYEGYSWHEGVSFELDRRMAESAIREAEAAARSLQR